MKIGPRKCIFWTTTITAIFLALTGWVDSPIVFIFVYGVAVSFSMLFNDQLACFTAVNNWWDRRRGEQGGYVQALGALGGVVFPPIITWLFLNFSWKSALIIMAVLLMLITAIPQMIFMRDHPSELGLEMDGGPAEGKPAKPGKARRVYQGYKSPVDWEIKDAVRCPQLWIVGLAWGSTVFGYCAVQYFGMTHLIMNGFADITAASAVSIMSGALLVGSLILSPLTDRMNPKIALVLIGRGGVRGLRTLRCSRQERQYAADGAFHDCGGRPQRPHHLRGDEHSGLLFRRQELRRHPALLQRAAHPDRRGVLGGVRLGADPIRLPVQCLLCGGCIRRRHFVAVLLFLKPPKVSEKAGQVSSQGCAVTSLFPPDRGSPGSGWLLGPPSFLLRQSVL